MTYYPELLNSKPYSLADGVEQELDFNGKMYIRANANQVVVLFQEVNDTSFATLATIPANNAQILDSIFCSKKSKIKVTGGTAYLKLYRE
jgi:hypothetical protein